MLYSLEMVHDFYKIVEKWNMDIEERTKNYKYEDKSRILKQNFNCILNDASWKLKHWIKSIEELKRNIKILEDEAQINIKRRKWKVSTKEQSLYLLKWFILEHNL